MVQVVLVQCNVADNQYQQKSEVLYTFLQNKPYKVWQINFLKCNSNLAECIDNVEFIRLALNTGIIFFTGFC